MMTLKHTLTLVLSFGLAVSAQAQERDRSPTQRSFRGPLGQAEQPPPPRAPEEGTSNADASFPSEVRSIDGTANNPQNPFWGSVDVEFLRLASVGYADGSSAPSGTERPNAREISNACAAQERSVLNTVGASDFLWQWGQFVDHDITETPVVNPAEAFDIAVPTGDADFDPFGTGTITIPLDRSLYEVVDGVRQQVNVITAFIDASNVYGSDEERANELRTLDGTGRLKTSAGELLPFNEAGLDNAPSSDASLFLAGDIRANEQAGLTAMHTLFVREHNYWAAHFSQAMPQLDGEGVYQMAKAIVAGEMQAITYREFLPLLLGRDGIRPYQGYQPSVDPGIANEFAAAAYRVGHTMLSSELLRLNADGSVIANGNLSLAAAFFNPANITSYGIEPYMRGLAAQVCQEIDSYLVDDVRNFLFGPPGAGGFDLAALNIQRGRDHGLPGYNRVRLDYGLQPARTFADMNRDPAVQANLAAVYASPADVDVWVGGLCEAHRPGAMVGETFFVILRDQFERLRDGDRFWYERYLPPFLKDTVEAQTLSLIIQRNTTIGNELPRDVFRVAPEQDETNNPPPPPPRRDGRRSR